MKKAQSKNGVAPAITLMIMAPLIAEVLSGSTRFSALFVFPIEVFVWGGGALLIRYAVRKWHLGWLNMLFLAIALSIAEEFLIQQTSLAPLVIQIKGVTYARIFGINYVYLLWALIYESVWVVFVPVSFTEMIFQSRRKELWVGKKGIVIIILLFLVGSFLAWFTWTQIARPKVFHVQAYIPPLTDIIVAIICIGCLVFVATGPFKRKLLLKRTPLNVPPGWLLAVMGMVWAILLYGIAVLAFGAMPSFPPMLAIAIGLLLAIGSLWLVPAWIISNHWKSMHEFSLIFGVILGCMLAGFIGFIGAAKVDLYFKILVDAVAVIYLVRMGLKMKNNQRDLFKGTISQVVE